MGNRSLLGIIGLALLVSGCLHERRDHPFVDADERIAHRRVELQKHLGLLPLASEWDHVIPYRGIREGYLEEDLVFVQTEDHWVHVVDSATGITRWTLDMQMPISARPGLNAEVVALLSHDVLWVVDRRTGGVIKKIILDFVPSSPPTPVGNRIYMGSFDEYLYAFNWQNELRDWRYKTDGAVTAKPIFLSPFLIFASHDNTVYVLRETNGTTNSTYATVGPITADLSSALRTVYGASRDFGVYAMSSALEWKFLGDSPFLKAPFRIESRGEDQEDTVYAVSEQETLYAIDPIFGKERWHVGGIDRVLFRGKGHDFALQPDKILVQIDNRTGEIRGHFDLGAFDFFFVNKTTNALIVGTHDGYLFSMSER